MTIVPTRTALLVIDMQNDFLEPSSPLCAPDGLALMDKFLELIEVCRAAGIEVIFTASVYAPGDSDLGRMGELFPGLKGANTLRRGSHGAQIHERLVPRPEELIVEKPRYSAFFRTGLDEHLRAKGIDTLIIGGVCTNVCCESTARDALFRDYRVFFLADATATYDLPDLGWGPVDHATVQRIALTDIAMHLGKVVTVAEIIQEIEGG